MIDTVWWIVKFKNPQLGFVDGNVQLMLNEDGSPKGFLSPESAYVWAESESFPIDNQQTFVMGRDTKEFFRDE